MLNTCGRITQEVTVESFALPINNMNKEMFCGTGG